MFKKGFMGKFVIYLLATIFVCYGLGASIFFSANKGGFSLNNNGSSSGKNSRSFTVDQEKQESISSIKEISIRNSSSRINVISEKRSDVKVTLTGKISSSGSTTEPTLITSLEDGTLNITVKQQNLYIGFVNIDLKLDIYVPSDYKESLKIDSSSGDVTIDNFTLNNLNCKLSSGNLKFNALTVNNFDYICSSGNLNAGSLNSKYSNLKSTSGNIDIGNFKGDLKSNSSSGNVKIAYSEFNNAVDIHVSSGRVDLKLPETAEFNLNAKASSGSVTCKFPITITDKQKDNYLQGTVKSDKNKVVISTSSGNINVLK